MQVLKILPISIFIFMFSVLSFFGCGGGGGGNSDDITIEGNINTLPVRSILTRSAEGVTVCVTGTTVCGATDGDGNFTLVISPEIAATIDITNVSITISNNEGSVGSVSLGNVPTGATVRVKDISCATAGTCVAGEVEVEEPSTPSEPSSDDEEDDVSTPSSPDDDEDDVSTPSSPDDDEDDVSTPSSPDDDDDSDDGEDD